MIRAVMMLTLVACAGATSAGQAHGQQVLEIDYSVGRVVIDDPWRSIRWKSAIDHHRGILYVHDDEEPDGIMAFSLATGEWLRTYMTPKGEGPREIPGGISGLSVGSNGKLYVSGRTRVLEFEQQGTYVDNWTPTTLPRGQGAVCDFDGRPAVPAPGGIIRRGPDRNEEVIGPEVFVGVEPDEYTQESVDMVGLQWKARIACTVDAAFVVNTFEDESDSVHVYYESNRRGVLPIPFSLATDQALTVGPLPATDGLGNLLLLGVSIVTLLRQDGGFRDMGALIDPESGCHAVIRNPEANMFQPRFMGIYQDSALIGYRYREETTENGRRVITNFDYTNKVVLHPLRRVSGRPCAGMLPTVN